MDARAPDHPTAAAQEPQLRVGHAFQFHPWSRPEWLHDSDSAVPATAAWIHGGAGRDGAVPGRYRSCRLNAGGGNFGDEVRSTQGDRAGILAYLGEHVLDDAYLAGCRLHNHSVDARLSGACGAPFLHPDQLRLL